MSIKFRSKELTPAELSFLKWQYGFDDEDEPFERALWQAIRLAWEADAASEASPHHLDRLGCRDAYPEEVALYVKFRTDRQRHGLERTDPSRWSGRTSHGEVGTAVDRRRRASSRA